MGRTTSVIQDVLKDLIIEGSDELVDLLRRVLPLRPGRVGEEAQQTWQRVAEMAQREGLLTGEEARKFLAELRQDPAEACQIGAC